MLVDTNLLIYATFSSSAEHTHARQWLEQLLDESESGVVLCWPVLYAFHRLITSPRVFGKNAISVSDGWATATAYLEQPAVRVVTQGPQHQAITTELATTPGLRSDDVSDLEIAALAIEHGLVLASHDSGFRRFSGLRVMDPLVDKSR